MCLDGDDKSELVWSSEVESLKDGVSVRMTRVSFFDDATTDFELLNTSYFWATLCSLSAGDLDGDGRDEVAMVGNHQGNLSMAGVVFDDLLASEPVYHIWDPLEGDAGLEATTQHDIVTGDFDGDGRDEVATIGFHNGTLHSRVWEWNDSPGGTLPAYDGMTLVQVLPEMVNSAGHPSLSSGDLDGDGLDELIATTHDVEFMLHYRIYDHFDTDLKIIRDVSGEVTMQDTNSATGDVDGDGVDELFLVGDDNFYMVGRLLDDANHDYALLKVLDCPRDDVWFYWFTVRVETGDIDGDGYDEYTILGKTFLEMYGEVYDDIRWGNDSQPLRYWLIGDQNGPTLTMDNFDGDGLILEYSGEHDRVETPSIPVVAIAASPIVEGSSQDPDVSFTCFGSRDAKGGEANHQLSISAELSFTFEGEPIEITDNERSALMSQFISTGTPIAIKGENISFEGPHSDDHIIYQRTIYDTYSYTILSWPDNDERIGESMTINVPVSIEIGYEPREDYNSGNGDRWFVGEETFKHQVGKVSTYPGTAERNATLERYPGWSSKDKMVEKGEGATDVSIDLSEWPIDEGQLRFGTPWDQSGWSTDETLHGTIGLTSENMYEVTIGESTIFEGGIGNFKDVKKAESHGYTFGLYVYQLEVSENGPVYLVIDYWVEGYEGNDIEDQVKDDGEEDDASTPLYNLIAVVSVLLLVAIMVVRKRVAIRT